MINLLELAGWKYIDVLNAPPNPIGDVAKAVAAKYDIRHEIGSGSFAKVYKAIELSTGQLRAVKIMDKSRFGPGSHTMLMLQREVDIMKDLDHPYIVKLVDGFEDVKHLWLVMELVTGGDLLDFITGKGGLSELVYLISFLLSTCFYSYLHRDPFHASFFCLEASRGDHQIFPRKD